MPLLTRGRDNLASAGLDVARLNGQVYTPLPLATRIVDGLRWAPGDLLDPACGDGVFLEAAVRRAAREDRPVSQVMGWDLDPDAVSAAWDRLQRVCSDLGVPGPGELHGPRLRHGDALNLEPERPVSVVVGNPPYLESKRMPASLKARVRARCPVAAHGGFDLYGAFVELGTRFLADAGELALVVPNRILVTRATRNLRAHLLRQGRVSVLDLSDHDVFGPAAAVYPVVLELDRSQPPAYAVVHDTGTAELPARVVAERLGHLLPILPADPVLHGLVRRLLQSAELPALQTRLEVRWTVSFHRAGLRDQYVTSERPDSPHARRFLGGGRFKGNRELAPYAITWAGAWIDHDEARAKRDRNGLPPLALFEAPKVVLTQNARRCRAALDTTGLVLKDTFPLVTLRRGADPDLLPWLVLVLNSRLFHVVYEILYGGTRKGGRFLHFLRSYLHPLPLPDPPPDAAELHEALVAAPDDPALQARAEALVRQAYALTPAEAAAVDQVEVPEP